MPTYDYICTACGHEFAVRQGMREPRLTQCPACRQQTLQRRLNAPALKITGIHCAAREQCAQATPCCCGQCPHRD